MSVTEIIVLLALVFLASQLLLFAYRAVALRKHWLDVPNQRSSHSTPVPGGAGACLAIVFFLVFAYLLLIGSLSSLAVCMAGLSLAMAATGWIDDRTGLSRRVRAVIYLSCAVLFAIGANTDSSIWMMIFVTGFVFAFVNAFNFMDGIDGIAASQVLFYCVAVFVLSPAATAQDLQITLLVVATLAAGFLVWNWAPAKLFLGDAGSLFFGFLLAAIAIIANEASVVSLLSSLILLATFISDAAVTLICRFISGERVQDAHRTHLYQLLAVKWGGHARVVMLYCVVNITVLMPLAAISEVQTGLATILFLVTYTILCAIVWFYRRRLL